MHAEYANYVEEPLTRYRSEIFQRLIRKISGGSVCDLGCHAVGHYWAMGYAERVEDIAFYDVSSEALALQQRTIDTLSPDEISSRYKDTLDFLQSQAIASGDREKIAVSIQDKADRIAPFDFLRDEPQHIYDWVLAIESLEIVETQEAYVKAFRTARKLLKPGTGKLMAVVVPYVSRDDNVECLCNAGLEGLLNPDSEATRTALNNAGFTDVSIEEEDTLMENYPHACFIEARH